jgi:hypothetical protein
MMKSKYLSEINKTSCLIHQSERILSWFIKSIVFHDYLWKNYIKYSMYQKLLIWLLQDEIENTYL